MQEEIKGARGLRKALSRFTDDLAIETQKELGKAMAPIARKARGFIPSSINLSGWQQGTQKGKWENRAWNRSEAIAGIGYSTTPSRPNRNGFVTLARIVNASAAGAIYETAGRKTDGKTLAGSHFIDQLNEQGLIVDANSRAFLERKGRKFKGRAIFRAWKEDGGKTKAAVEKAIDNSRDKFYMIARGN
jgi:hypothetical protein